MEEWIYKHKNKLTALFMVLFLVIVYCEFNTIPPELRGGVVTQLQNIRIEQDRKEGFNAKRYQRLSQELYEYKILTYAMLNSLREMCDGRYARTNIQKY